MHNRGILCRQSNLLNLEAWLVAVVDTFAPCAAGTDDDTLVLSGVLEDSFFSFVEERAVQGNTDVYGREDSWYRDLFKCDPTDPTKQLCEKCGTHCNSWDWETSGYSVLNSTEFEIENLYWSES